MGAFDCICQAFCFFAAIYMYEWSDVPSSSPSCGAIIVLRRGRGNGPVDDPVSDVWSRPGS